jgi:hypothetical protein
MPAEVPSALSFTATAYKAAKVSALASKALSFTATAYKSAIVSSFLASKALSLAATAYKSAIAHFLSEIFLFTLEFRSLNACYLDFNFVILGKTASYLTPSYGVLCFFILPIFIRFSRASFRITLKKCSAARTMRGLTGSLFF